MYEEKRAVWEPRLRSALIDATDWHEIEASLRSGVSDDEHEEARPLVFAFGFMLLVPKREEGRQQSGYSFAPSIQLGPNSFPPPLESIDDTTLDEWQFWASLIDEPSAQSRLRDLLWERRHGDRPDLHARAAARGYLALATGEWHPMSRVFCAERAIELGRSIGDHAITDDGIRSCVRLAEQEIESTERRPGIALEALAAVVEAPKNERPEGLSDLIQRAFDRYAPDPWIEQSIRDLQAEIAETRDQTALRHAQVTRWREEAAVVGGLVGHTHLEHALQLAQTHGLKQQADEILRELQAFKPEDLDLKSTSVEISLPKKQTEQFIAHVTSLPSLADALRAFGTYGPPTGDADQVDAAIEKLAEQFPLQRVIPRKVLGPHSSIVFEAHTQEAHNRLDRARHESLSINVFAIGAVEILDSIEARFGRPSGDTLTAYFSSSPSDEVTSAQLGDGAARFWAKDFNAATHILAPAIEAYIRALAAQIGLPVIRLPQGDRPGGVRPLGMILAGFEGLMDESWRRYLSNALTDPLGVNLRNAVSHGLGATGSPQAAALLVHIACHLSCLTPQHDDNGTTPN